MNGLMAGKEKENPLNCGIKKLKGNGKDVARVGIASAIATDFTMLCLFSVLRRIDFSSKTPLPFISIK